MNIKIVFKCKIHKLPKEIQTLEQIRTAILQIYPQELLYDFNLYTKIYLEQEPVRIRDENHFFLLKKSFTAPSMKLLVKKINQKNFTQKEIELLEQSIALQKSEVNINKQEKIVKQSEKPKGELQQLVENLIDERLKFHNLIPNIVQPNYKMAIVYCLPVIRANPGSNYLWKVELLNQGNVTWKKNEIFLECIQGAYRDQTFKLSQDIPPEQIGTFSSKMISPSLPQYLTTQIFRLCHRPNNAFFGREIKFQFIFPNLQFKALLNEQNPQLKQDQFQKFVEVTGASDLEAAEYLDKLNDYDEMLI